MKIALLTCQQLPDLLQSDQFLIPELAKHNIEASVEIWDNPNVNWSDFNYLIFRNTWDYFEKEVEFNNWLKKIQLLGIKTLNSIEVINKNKHKFYLKDLEKLGIKILPTLFINKTDRLDLSINIPHYWKKAVVKPAFSAGSFQTEVFEVADIAKINQQYQPIAAEKDLLLQQFMPEIQTLGETSFVFFNKKFSHCVNKKPAAGDFRIQMQFGGQYTLVHPSQDVINQAQAVVDSFDEELLYARVDAIIIDNQIHLMEVECIEPDLYFDLAPGSQQLFVNEIVQLIS